MSTCEMNADDFFMSLNGFDEIAVAKHFGGDVYALKETPFTFLRALAFVAERRNGLSDNDAKNRVMEMTLAEVNDYFPEAEDEPMPEEPGTPEGKDDSPSD